MIILSKIYSRERSLFYFCLWDDCDRLGFKKWANYKIKNNLFLKKEDESKVTIYYGKKEFKEMLQAIRKKIISDGLLMEKFNKMIEKEWRFLSPYVNNKKEIKNIKELKVYYKSLVNWWSAMTIICLIHDLRNIPNKVKKEALDKRITMQEYSTEFNKIFEIFFKKNFPQYQKYLRVIMPSEVFGLQKKVFSENNLKEFQNRLSGYGMLNGKIYQLDQLNDKIKKQKLKIENEKIRRANIIKGEVACRGIVKGKVEILIDKKMINKFSKGNILVAEMTEPDYLPAIKKAAAIITDEGGLLSHAAIISREMKKPCIIGTKIATKVLKDGDLVEVDANKGIVKIIK